MLDVQNRKFPKDCILISGDFESLYTNLEHNLVLDYLSDFMKDKLNNFEDLMIKSIYTLTQKLSRPIRDFFFNHF